MPETINLLKQIITANGKINFYVIDTYNDLQLISEDEKEIFGCRAYCIENGKYYFMGSEKKWTEEYLVTTGNGDKIAVDENDNDPDYLSNKFIAAEGSGIILNVTDEKKLEIKYSEKDYETEFLETIPFASMQESINPLYGHSTANLIATAIIPDNSFSFIEGESTFVCYSDSGNMKNCRLVVLKLEDDYSATIIAYSKVFQASERVGSKIEKVCEWAGEKIKGGQKYYFGIIGTMVDTSWLKMFGYQSWASQNISIEPKFNICSSCSFSIDLKNYNIPYNQIESNSANAIYIGVTH